MHKRSVNLAVIVVILFAASNALASGSGMPWETPLNQILNSITGPVAKALGAIAIAATGLALAFGEGGRGFPKDPPDRLRAVYRIHGNQFRNRLFRLRRGG